MVVSENVFNEKGERIRSTDLELKMSAFDERVEACKDCSSHLFCVKHQHEWVAIRYPKVKP